MPVTANWQYVGYRGRVSPNHVSIGRANPSATLTKTLTQN